MSGLSGEMLSLIAHYAVLFDECYLALFEEDSTKAEKLMTEIGEIFFQSVSRQEGENGILLSYRVENDSLEAFLNTIIEYFEIDAETSAFLREQTAQFLSQYNIILRVEFLIDAASGALQLALLQGTLTEANGAQIMVDLALRFTGEQTRLAIMLEPNDSSYFVEMAWTKREESGVIAYDLTLDSEIDGSKKRLAEAEYVYDVGGGVKVSATLGLDSEDPMDVTLLGQITVAEDEAKISFSSLSYKNVKVIFDAAVIFTPDATAPQKPGNAMDIVEMTDEEWNAVIEELKGSIIGELFFGEKEEVAE